MPELTKADCLQLPPGETLDRVCDVLLGTKGKYKRCDWSHAGSAKFFTLLTHMGRLGFDSFRLHRPHLPHRHEYLWRASFNGAIGDSRVSLNHACCLAVVDALWGNRTEIKL